jgi:hypothetical protein
MKKLYSIFIFTALFFTINAVYSQTNAISDSSLELGRTNPYWTANSTHLGSTICSNALCGNCGGPCIAHSGAYYVWIGGYLGGLNLGYISQSLTIPLGTPAFLSFWYMMPIASKYDMDTVGVMIDGTPLWFSTNADSTLYHSYTKITIPIDAFATQTTHTLYFGGRTHGTDNTNFIFDDISIITHSGAGINSNHLLEGISIYPNPTTEKIFVDVNAPVVEDYTIILYNMQGQKVFEQNYPDFNNNKIEISTTNIAKGAYSMVINSKYDRIIEKVIVQ